MKYPLLRRFSFLAALVAAAGVQAASSADREDQFRQGWLQFAMYLPNRLLDAADIVTVEFGAGSTAGAQVNLTRFAQLGGAAGDSYVAGTAYHRQFGTGYLSASEFAAAGYSYNTSYFDWISGTMKNYVFDVEGFEPVNPEAAAYQEKAVDLWSVGARVGFLVNVDVQFHPIAVADFVTGLVGCDLESDEI